MLEQDCMMRQIKERVRAIFKIIFNIDTSSPYIELLGNEEEKEMLKYLMEMVDTGKINDAENKLEYFLDKNKDCDIKMALVFYSYLNEKDDEFLERYQFSREEISMGMKRLLEMYGMEEMGLLD